MQPNSPKPSASKSPLELSLPEAASTQTEPAKAPTVNKLKGNRFSDLWRPWRNNTLRKSSTEDNSPKNEDRIPSFNMSISSDSRPDARPQGHVKKQSKDATFITGVRPRIISHLSPFRKRWDFMIAISIIYVAVMEPLSLSFFSHKNESADWMERCFTTLDAIDILIDIQFIIHIVLNFRTSYTQDGLVIVDSHQIRSTYISSGRFFIDLITSLPYSTAIVLVAIHDCDASDSVAAGTLLRLIRLFRLTRLFRIYNISPLTLVSVYLSLFLNAFWFFLASHWLACLYFYLIIEEDFPDGSSFYISGLEGRDLSFQYFRGLQWGMAQLASMGAELNPNGGAIEIVLTIFIVIVGILLAASIIGNINEIVLLVSAGHRRHSELVAYAREFVQSRQLPPPLREKIFRYLEIYWKQQKALDENELLSILPSQLARKVRLRLYQDLMKAIPILSQIDKDLLYQMVALLQPRIAIHGLSIVIPNRRPQEVVFVSGRCNFIDSYGVIVGVLVEGGVFGAVRLTGRNSQNPRLGVQVTQNCAIYFLTLEHALELASRWEYHWKLLEKQHAKQIIMALYRDRKHKRRLSNAAMTLVNRSSGDPEDIPRRANGHGNRH